ncbi:ABC transporter ATP-binding protein [Microbacterium sp. NC79]|uniref:ABC transporter ATP-binding protein n=1 Tax=Microbacterium sp. NC79 TaxID=2851009 RepID=UPI001C2BE9DF|nr:oligopeptide/dipeptide ABC transporter ATP-binding protein [Microbacterium sp. NC79]MBV0894130.1 ATP-binding cassette domain-containing protein [Microbacterium sp. NC79]
MPLTESTTQSVLKHGANEPVLAVDNLVVTFPVRGGQVSAVADVTFEVREGETLGILGESGCGKSSAGRAVMQIPSPTSGSVRLDGRELTGLTRKQLRTDRAAMQMIFQDPVSSLNPRRKVKDLVAEGRRIRGEKVSDAEIRQLLTEVGLDPDTVWDRRPHELSGGQCQRVCIARALMMRPRLMICDEPVSSLDVSVQAQILNLLEDAKTEHALSMVFIAHDLAVVKNISDRVMIMYLGKVCEVVPSDTLVTEAVHPYTKLLLSSVPGAEDDVPVPAGELPSPLNPPSGCRFRTRCPFATEKCAADEPALETIAPDHQIACHYARELMNA